MATPGGLAVGLLLVAVGIALVALGSGLYLTCRLGLGPRDGLMTIGPGVQAALTLVGDGRTADL
ncbi:MAG: hypothetical protein M3459_12340 [Actinomycetota bacterium]|nr:hypothetical protein [Actinomycetota bacterium]